MTPKNLVEKLNCKKKLPQTDCGHLSFQNNRQWLCQCVGLLDIRHGLEMLLKLKLRNCYGKVFKLEFLGGGFHSTKYPSKYVDTSK